MCNTTKSNINKELFNNSLKDAEQTEQIKELQN